MNSNQNIERTPCLHAITTKAARFKCRQLIASNARSVEKMAGLFCEHGSGGPPLVWVLDTRDLTAVEIWDAFEMSACNRVGSVVATGLEEARTWFRHAPELLAILDEPIPAGYVRVCAVTEDGAAIEIVLLRNTSPSLH
jgi:hypothetical protein